VKAAPISTSVIAGDRCDIDGEGALVINTAPILADAIARDPRTGDGCLAAAVVVKAAPILTSAVVGDPRVADGEGAFVVKATPILADAIARDPCTGDSCLAAAVVVKAASLLAGAIVRDRYTAEGKDTQTVNATPILANIISGDYAVGNICLAATVVVKAAPIFARAIFGDPRVANGEGAFVVNASTILADAIL